MLQIVTTPSEANAAVICGFLKSCDIQASYAPNFSGRGARSASCIVYCIAEKAEEALKLLKEQGLLGPQS